MGKIGKISLRDVKTVAKTQHVFFRFLLFSYRFISKSARNFPGKRVFFKLILRECGNRVKSVSLEIYNETLILSNIFIHRFHRLNRIHIIFSTLIYTDVHGFKNKKFGHHSTGLASAGQAGLEIWKIERRRG